jgi:probable F420-dependent oxidoreductase
MANIVTTAGKSPQRPFRFGVLIHNWGSGREWSDKARRIEALGYRTFLISDHLKNQFAAMPALSLAAATTDLRVGTFVLANDFRHPVMLAKDVATLDYLSDGRFELGIGAGWSENDYRQLGIEFEPAPVRIERLTEALQVIKGFFAGTSLTFAGHHYHVSEVTGAPRPVQQPAPPILIGGGGKRILSLAAREADIVGLSVRTRPDGSGQDWMSATAAATEEKLEWIRHAAGDRFSTLELNVALYGVTLTDDRQAAAQQMAKQRPGMSDDDILTSPHFLIGNVDEIVDALRQRRERYGISYLVVPEIFAEPLAPVVARLSSV